MHLSSQGKIKNLFKALKHIHNEEQTKNWFKGEISKHIIELSTSDLNIGEIRRALARDDEFILVLKDKKLNSVISICFLTRDMSNKMLEGLALKK